MAQYGLELDQLDVNTAFLQGDLEEEIYMFQSIGFKTIGKENMICKMRTTLYELK